MFKPKTNPFYVVLVIVGVVFAITACAYGVMTVIKLKPQGADDHPLIKLMDERGASIMLVELALLAVLTFAAIGTEEFWTGAAKASSEAEKPVDQKLGK